jgi:hypothetical protein
VKKLQSGFGGDDGVLGVDNNLPLKDRAICLDTTYCFFVGY